VAEPAEDHTASNPYGGEAHKGSKGPGLTFRVARRELPRALEQKGRGTVGILDNFERGLERAVNGVFAKTFRSGLQPIEITSALKRELDTHAAVVSRDRILAPNRFVVRLAPSDYTRMHGLGLGLIDELTQLTQQHATAQGYQFAGAVRIELQEDETLTAGLIQVDSGNLRGKVVDWTPVLEINGTRHPLHKGRTIIGRGSDADITIDDSGTSRKHIEVLWDGSRAQLNDLGSTNGSLVDGQKVSKALLAPDSVIQIGRTRIVFQLVPQSADPTLPPFRPQAPPSPKATAAPPAARQPAPPPAPQRPPAREQAQWPAAATPNPQSQRAPVDPFAELGLGFDDDDPFDQPGSRI